MNLTEQEELTHYLYILERYKFGERIYRRHNGFEYELNNLKDILYWLNKTPEEVHTKIIEFEI